MKAKSITGRSIEETRSALEQSMADGFTPTLAVVFLAEEKNLDFVISLLTEKNIKIFGSSSGTNFSEGDVQQGQSGAVVMLLLNLDPKYFRLEIRGAGAGTTIEKAEQIAKSGLAAFKKPAFLIVSGGLTADGDDIIDGIENVCGKGTTIFGGLAADNLKVQRTYVFSNNEVTDLGLVSLILDEEKIALNGVAVGGWKPVGIDRVITKSEGNVVYTIDNEPALEFIKRYAGLNQLDMKNGLNFILASNFQLQLLREGKHPVMRTPMWANEDGSIVFAGKLPQGSKARLTLLPGFEVVEGAMEEFQNYKKEQPDVDALIMFSCAGRELALGPYASEEVSRVKEIWNAPMAGFFCYGEIGRVVSGQHEFHNMTCSLAILKEKMN